MTSGDDRLIYYRINRIAIEIGGVVISRKCPLVSWRVSAFAAYCSVATNTRLLCQPNRTFGNLIHGHPWELDEAERNAKVIFGALSGGPSRMLVN